MTTPSPVEVRVTHRFAARPADVFDAWLDVELIGRWMFGHATRDEAIVRLSTDPCVGGRFSFVVRRQGQEIDHVGEYLELARPTRLVFTWAIAGTPGDPSVVTIDLAADGDGCRLTLVHTLHPDWAEYASRTEAGWTTMLTALAAMIDG
jgi:uncharacterized protein YndB with AHSA1/START domain